MSLLQKFAPKQKDLLEEFIGVKKEQQQNTYKQTRREIFGEHIFPLAQDRYAEKAAKLTGMIVSSLDHLYDSNKTHMNQILDSNDIVNDIVRTDTFFYLKFFI